MANQDLPVLVAETNDVRPFARLLRGIGLRHNAVMEISEAGFAVTVEEVRTLCAIAWIPTSLFTSFTYNQPSIPATFEFNLDSLLQCLNIFGNAGPTSSNTATSAVKSKRRWAGEGEVGVDEDNEEYQVSGRKGKERKTGMRMEWTGQGHDLNVLLSDDSRGPTTTCELRTMEPEELMNAQFDPDDMALYVIMKSEWLRDALFDLPPSCTRITLLAHPPKEPIPPREPNATVSSIGRRERRAEVGQFTILAEGDFGMTELDYPNDKEVMDKFDCAEKVKFSYNSSHFALLHRALHQSLKVCLQIEKSGFLCVQIMMPLSENVEIGGHSGILEFKMHALEEDD
ncbi:hypothetical protein L486_06710 [Kwoniella mangroviensis CBS 10435]|uniref:Cell cycle checkpoint protein n=1 Tax=Kwoniella mangroviensis CBS 10435 TaxID=1331196 RepID=A0A1B9IKF1_9TREE|nr:uncharacterized protein I203_05409 [Kwoniella mangroviensis CBS 8507]OCF55953.1 hypothetical protein L486_06710 [Kwoniella mangroviensis CBS 10435]OCF65728.1 hypothetical protein I203_05409 [Kwoniella mangroviensis CBS 8507]OCF71550.1 hypothetical protein I204_07608 [Kwoniella mangroviensis CBS 8886]